MLTDLDPGVSHDMDRPHQYQAILILAFGGPEGPDEVMPFMQNVLRGRNIPPHRIAEVSEHYHLFEGVSPHNQQIRYLIQALSAELTSHGPNLPIYWGNRNWHPLLPDTLRQMVQDGVKRALCLFISPYSSYSGCRQYREDLAAAQAEVGADAPELDKIRAFYNHPGFIVPNAEHLLQALARIPQERRAQTPVLFTAHSIPEAMAANSDYVQQLQESCLLVAEEAQLTQDRWQLVYQSRSGPPAMPWLEPDICDHLTALHREAGNGTGLQDVVVMPIGFLSDHMEVLYDLDTEAKQLADQLGINMVRAATVGVHPTYIAMIRELILERMTENPVRRSLGSRGVNHDICPFDCCLSGRPGPAKAVAAGQPDPTGRALS